MEANIVVPHRSKRVTALLTPPTSKMHFSDDCWCGATSTYVPREAGAGLQDLGDSSIPYTQQSFPTGQVVADQYAPDMTFKRQDFDDDEEEKLEVHQATLEAMGHCQARTLKDRIRGLDGQLMQADKDQQEIAKEMRKNKSYFWDYYKKEDGNPDWEVFRQVYPDASPEQRLTVYHYQKNMEEQLRPTRTTPNVLTTGFDNGMQFKANAD